MFRLKKKTTMTKKKKKNEKDIFKRRVLHTHTCEEMVMMSLTHLWVSDLEEKVGSDCQGAEMWCWSQGFSL